MILNIILGATPSLTPSVCVEGDGLINFGTRLSVTHLNLTFMWCWFGLATTKKESGGIKEMS